jgi:hypothetical protein
VLYSRAPKTRKTVLLLCNADGIEKTSHTIANHSWDVTSFHLCGSEFTEPLPRSWFHTPVVPMLRPCITAISVTRPFWNGSNTSYCSLIEGILSEDPNGVSPYIPFRRLCFHLQVVLFVFYGVYFPSAPTDPRTARPSSSLLNVPVGPNV